MWTALALAAWSLICFGAGFVACIAAAYLHGPSIIRRAVFPDDEPPTGI